MDGDASELKEVTVPSKFFSKGKAKVGVLETDNEGTSSSDSTSVATEIVSVLGPVSAATMVKVLSGSVLASASVIGVSGSSSERTFVILSIGDVGDVGEAGEAEARVITLLAGAATGTTGTWKKPSVGLPRDSEIGLEVKFVSEAFARFALIGTGGASAPGRYSEMGMEYLVNELDLRGNGGGGVPAGRVTSARDERPRRLLSELCEACESGREEPKVAELCALGVA